MEPQFRFCTSADGTRIAYATFGNGPDVLYANTWLLSIDAQVHVPEAVAYFEALAARARITMFDRRGTGASARDGDDLSPEAESDDIAAVADAAGLSRFTLFADIASGPSAVYVARDDARARNLVLWTPIAETMLTEGLARRIREDWSLHRRLWASNTFPDGPVSLQKAASKAHKDSVTQEMAARRASSQRPDYDVLFPRVPIRTLILQRERTREGTRLNEWEARARRENTRFAALLPEGQLRFVPGYPPTPYPDHEAIVDAVFEFIGVNEHAPTELLSGTSIILFADIVDSTAMTDRMGNAAFRERSKVLEARIRDAVREHGGESVAGRTLGDGVLATFPSAAQGIAAALTCAEAGADLGLALHLGLHAGDVLREDGNVHGIAVSLASRVSGLTGPNEIFVSQTVRDLARASTAVTFEDRGEQALRGIEEPVRVYAARGQRA